MGRTAIGGSGGGWRFLRCDIAAFKPEASTIEVFRDGLEANPSSAEALGGFAGGATAGEGVQNHVALAGQELDEELGELHREAGWVRLDLLLHAAALESVGATAEEGICAWIELLRLMLTPALSYLASALACISASIWRKVRSIHP